jgi:PAS domain S-box-containing protein
MPDAATNGVLAALDLAAFRELEHGSFRAIDRLPGWYFELNPGTDPNEEHQLGEHFPFIENFLVDARSFWNNEVPGQLRSGPWTEVGSLGEETSFEATAVFHRESRILLIQLLGEDYDTARGVLQKAREAASDHERLARIHEAFLANESEARVLLRSVPDTLFRLRRDGTYLDFSPDRGDPEPSSTRRIRDQLSEPTAELLLDNVAKALDQGATQTFDYTSSVDGETRNLEARIAPCGSDEVLVLVRDITERKEAERELFERLRQIRDHRDELLLIFNELGVGTIMTDESGHCAFLSDPARLLFGIAEEQVLGKNWGELPWLSPAQAAQLKSMQDLPRRLRKRVSVQWEREKGRRFWMELDLQDDPRDRRRKILFLYDVTEVYNLRRRLDDRHHFEGIVGKSDRMQEVYRLIEDLAPVDVTVLIEGETGSGKELVAKALHERSARRDGPFIPVNCAGLTESLIASQLFGHKRGSFTGATQDQQGVFEAANGGVLLLDEIGDVPPNVQASMLRALQEREITRVGETRPRKIDVRVVAATHRDLDFEVSQGRFRSDLLYRIRVARIHLPALRERVEDIPLLVSRFLGELRAAMGKPVQSISTEVMRRLTDYDWPGNVRELRSSLEFAFIRCRRSVIEVSDLPPELLAPQLEPADMAIEGDDERERYLQALERSKGNRTRAARLLGISRATFYRRIAELDISASPD